MQQKDYPERFKYIQPRLCRLDVDIRIFGKRRIIYQLRTAGGNRRYEPIKLERVDRSGEFADIPFDIS